MNLVASTALLTAFALTSCFFSEAIAYEVTGDVADGGEITGQILFHGVSPTRKVIPNKDVDTCGGPREDPVVNVGAGDAVADVLVYIKDVPKGKSWPEPGKTPQLNNKSCRFEPAVQVIPAGPIDVVNKDPVLHNTHGYYGKRTAFNVALPNQGQSISADLNRTGTVKVDCDAHGWMEGWIFVRDNPYYAITGADGKFKITGIPPGNYTLVTEQPYSVIVQQPVTVAANGSVDKTIELKLK
jgi:plastocyanin